MKSPGEPWWEQLQGIRERIEDTDPENDEERRRLMQEWKETLARVRKLAREDRAFLLKEINEIIQTAPGGGEKTAAVND